MAQSKQQKEGILLVVLLAVAGLVWYFYFANKQTGPGVGNTANYAPINIEDYSPILQELHDAQSTEYKPSGRNIFVAGPAPAPVTSTGTKTANATPAEPARLPVGPQLPPEFPPPVLNMKFFGYATVPASGPRRAFLLDGEEVRIVQEGDTLQNRIRITHIGNESIEFEDTVTGKKNKSNLELPPAV